MLTRSVGSARVATSLMHWPLRIVLFFVLVSHGIGKLQYPVAFNEKFDFSPGIATAVGAVELLAAAAFIVGGVFAARFGGAVVTWLACLDLLIIQVGAVIIARWPRWLEYAQPPGAEYSTTLIAVAISLAAMAYLLQRRVREPVSTFAGARHRRW